MTKIIKKRTRFVKIDIFNVKIFRAFLTVAMETKMRAAFNRQRFNDY